ncbi:MAG: type IV pilus secretin PilQ, partial [Gammaproteobacteria bacterium]|nr:type IV pilus secretin PilQ [Gammaproteobacteria bacterium]
MKNTKYKKGIFTFFMQCLFISSMAISFMTGTAQANSLEEISYTSLPGDKVQIKLTMSEPAAKPLSFTIDNPARIALDLADTNSNVAKSQA